MWFGYRRLYRMQTQHYRLELIFKIDIFWVRLHIGKASSLVPRPLIDITQIWNTCKEALVGTRLTSQTVIWNWTQIVLGHLGLFRSQSILTVLLYTYWYFVITTLHQLYSCLGDHCERCSTGYYGNATAGSPHPCKACLCYGGHNTCDLTNNGSFKCHCRNGYEGDQCENCTDGFFGTPTEVSIWQNRKPLRVSVRVIQWKSRRWLWYKEDMPDDMIIYNYHYFSPLWKFNEVVSDDSNFLCGTGGTLL